MKIRNGFVSNSSSSSFIVTLKNGKKLDKSILLETFEVGENSPLYGFADDLANWIVGNVEEHSIKSIHEDYIGKINELTDEEIIQNILDNDIMDEEDLMKIKSGEWKYYYGSVSTDSGEALEEYLCNSGMDIETDTIKIECNGY